MTWTATEARGALTQAITGLVARRKAERQRAMIASCAEARAALKASKYTGKTVTDWAEGVERRIEIPNPLVIEVSR